jgi:uncharacterized protein (DUF697 family)
MHDIDLTTNESEMEAYTMDEYEMDEYESDDYEYEIESGYDEEYEFESPFDEQEEMELAAELLSVTNEEELDQFLGKIFKKAWRGVRKVGSKLGRIARPLGGILKGVAKKALPAVGGALGSFIPIPGVGTTIGTALGSAASRALEMELEGMDPQDQEFEAARRIVRIAGAAAKKAAAAPAGQNPQQVAKVAVTSAAKLHVPGLPKPGAKPPTHPTMATVSSGRARSGRWVRRGRKIVLLGV